MIASVQDTNVMYNQMYDNKCRMYDNADKVYMTNVPHPQAAMQQTAAPSNASTWTGNDMDSVTSADSYWENTGNMGSPQQMRAQQQQMYMVQDGQKQEQGQ